MPKIEKLPSGSYRIRITTTVGGRRQVKSFIGPNRTDLLRSVRLWEQEQNRPDTITDLIEAYIEAKSRVLSPATIRGYISSFNSIKRDLGAFCELPAEEIDSRTFQKAINSLKQSPKTIKNFHGLITSALIYADIDPPRVSLPKGRKPVYHVPTEHELRQILNAARGTRLYIPLQLAVLGLRRGEICALSAPDLEGNRLHIHHSMVKTPDLDWIIKEPKTEASDRYIYIPEQLAEQLRAEGFPKMNPSQLSNAFNKFLIRNDFDHMRFHDMRHFFASYCHNVLKLSSAQIQKLGGWETDSVLKNNYIQSMEDELANNQVINALNHFVEF